jgi:hypothetical protein
MTGAKSRKLPRLWDANILSAKGRKVRRYVVHRFRGYLAGGLYNPSGNRYTIHEKMPVCSAIYSRWLPNPARTTWPKCYIFRTRAAAENWLKKTTVRSYELAMLNKALDRSA